MTLPHDPLDDAIDVDITEDTDEADGEPIGVDALPEIREDEVDPDGTATAGLEPGAETDAESEPESGIVPPGA